MTSAPDRPKHLVTGANGFSGRHLLAELRAQSGLEAIGLVRTGPDPERVCDLGDERAVRRVLEAWRPSRIYHLVGSFTNDWERDLKSNVETTRILLETVRELALPCRILLIGSAAEYGNAPPIPLTEETPLRPVSIYGLTKVLQTELLGFYHRRHGLHIVLARPFNLFGEGCPATLFPGHVAQQIARVKAGVQTKIRVRDLSAERDYLPVGEAIRAYVRILEHGQAGEVYNVGSGIPVRLSEFLSHQLIPQGLTLDDVEIHPSPPDARPSPNRIFADIGKYTALPGTNPTP